MADHHAIPTSPDAPLLLHDDCLDALARFAPASIDAFVDDPPAGIAFMGRTWDDLRGYQPRTALGRHVLATYGGGAADAVEASGMVELAEQLRARALPGWAAGFVAFMAEVSAAKLRVAKPGAHSLSWALPRTSDLTMLAMRLAGWEIRDSITHLFGGGFPKSHDVSKAIDKMHGAEREVTRQGQYASRRVSPAPMTTMDGGAMRHDGHDITAPATEDAQRWAGWGTALSPAAEYWILARAPLAGTVAANVLAHGTGAINIDATRTPASDKATFPAGIVSNAGTAYGGGAGMYADRPRGEDSNPSGRWPKNAVLSCALACEGDRHSPACPRRVLDEMSGHLAGRGNTAPETKPGFGSQYTYGDGAGHEKYYGPSASGGASRFFPTFGYFPKASDRSIPGREDIENKHPTIKNPALMRWLVRLVTPPGGIVLDCFMGSGTTGIACVAERVSFIGIERDEDSFAISRGRILAAIGSPESAAEGNLVAPTGSQLNMF